MSMKLQYISYFIDTTGKQPFPHWQVRRTKNGLEKTKNLIDQRSANILSKFTKMNCESGNKRVQIMCIL